MLRSKQRLLEINSKIADFISSNGGTASADETTTALVNKLPSILASLINRSIKSVVIPDGVTSIGGHIFYGCDSLTSITIPDSVTSISGYAFYGCSKLTSITIPDGVTSIGEYAFYGCSKLTSITIPDGVTSISTYAFYSCTSLENITIPDSVKSIGNYAFSNANFESVTIPNSVTSIGSYSFSGCLRLTAITIPNSVTSISHITFYYCRRLTDVVLGDGFNASLNLSSSTLYTRETILQWLNALADRTGLTAYTLTLGSTNLAKLTEQDILIATNKNWTLA